MTGLGALASRLVGGERARHKDLEQALADFVGCEAVMTLVSGYLTNVTVIQHIMGSRDVIFLDELSHNSIISGCKSLTGRRRLLPPQRSRSSRPLLTEKRGALQDRADRLESLFSMDGDIVDLPRMIELKAKHSTWLLLDEAHSIGVLGERVAAFASTPASTPTTSTSSSARCRRASPPAAASSARNPPRSSTGSATRLPGFVYSVGLSPVISAGALAALELAQTETWRLAALRPQQRALRRAGAGGRTRHRSGDRPRRRARCSSPTRRTTLAASRYLAATTAFYVPPIVQVGVPKDQPRLRFFMSAMHTEADIRGVIACDRSPSTRSDPCTHRGGGRRPRSDRRGPARRGDAAGYDDGTISPRTR